MPSPHLNPQEVVGAVVGLLLIGALVVIWAPHAIDRLGRKPDRLGGWYTQQASAKQRWAIAAWVQACDLSTERSRARRGKEPQ